MNQTDETGRCLRHPSMQLKSLQRNGELRVLMSACPLCVSGLPAEGESISWCESTPSKDDQQQSYCEETSEIVSNPASIYDDFHNFLQKDQQKTATHHDNSSPTPKPNQNSPRKPRSPRPNSPKSSLDRQMNQGLLTPPYHENTSERRPDPEESTGPIHHHHPEYLRRYRKSRSESKMIIPQMQRLTPKQNEHLTPNHHNIIPTSPQPQHLTFTSHQLRTPYLTKEYSNPQKDEMSLDCILQYNSDEISVPSINSVKRRLYKSDTVTEQFCSHDDNINHIPKQFLEEDEVSAVSMNSVTRNLYKNNNEKSENHDDLASASVSSTDKESSTSQYDNKGKCIRHPTVRLRKKKLFGGWQIVLSNCPECCLDEMRRFKDERSKSGRSKCGSSRSQSGSKGGKSMSSSSKKKKKDKQRSKKLPISHVNIDEEDDKSIGTASTITISSYTASSFGRPTKNWQHFSTNDEISSGSACVTNMPFTDSNGERGRYSGSVDCTTGKPHGFGTIYFRNGLVFKGQWSSGNVCEGNETSRIFYPPMPQNKLETHYEDETNTSQKSGSRPRLPALIPQPQTIVQIQQQRKVVCGMPWTNSSGSGMYTGEANGQNIPDGVGSMRYNTGVVAEGLWRGGEMVEDANDDSG